MGTVVVQRRNADVLEIHWAGTITRTEVEALHARLEKLFHTEKARWILGDAARVTGFEAACRAPAGRLLTLLRENNIERIVAIAPSTPVRLVCATLALITGLPAEIVESPQEADRHLRTLAAQPRSR